MKIKVFLSDPVAGIIAVDHEDDTLRLEIKPNGDMKIDRTVHVDNPYDQKPRLIAYYKYESWVGYNINEEDKVQQ